MPVSIPQLLADLLEQFLAYGTAGSSAEDSLVIRRARGFALIGLCVVVLTAGAAELSQDPRKVLIASTALLLFMTVGIVINLILNKERTDMSGGQTYWYWFYGALVTYAIGAVWAIATLFNHWKTTISTSPNSRG